MRKNLSIALLSCISVMGFGQVSTGKNVQSSNSLRQKEAPRNISALGSLQHNQVPLHRKAEEQTQFFKETFGVPLSNTLVNDYTGFDNSAPIIFTGSTGANANYNTDVRLTSPSAGYEGSSGGGNVMINTENKWLMVEGIDTSDYENVVLSFGNRKNQTAANNELKVEVSSDGVNWTALTYSRSTGAGTANTWDLVNVEETLPSVDNLRIRFSGTNSIEWRVDDIVLSGEEASSEPAGCLEASLGAYPYNIVYPPCMGAPTIATSFGSTQDYSLIGVTAGNTYTFSSSYATDFITIGNEAGDTVLATGTGSVVWTATSTQVVRFYTHANETCGVDSNWNHERKVDCGGEAVVFDDPDFPCFQGDGGISILENAEEVSTEGIYRVADDFTVGENGFRLKQITLNALSTGTITEAQLNIRKDNGNKPGDILQTITMAPSSSSKFGSAYGMDAYRLTFDLATTVDLPEGKYWLDPTMSGTDGAKVSWEVTSSGTNGSVVYFSNNLGSSWTPDVYDGYQGVFYVAGECDAVVAAGCLEAPKGQWPNGAPYAPTCNGVAEAITTFGFTGEYSLVNVKAGTEYKFTLSDSTFFITIGNEAGDTVLASGTGEVTWTSPVDQVIRFYSHIDSDCNYGNTLHSRIIQCGTALPPPANDDCANALPIACGDTDTGSTVFATDSNGNGAADVFYTYTGDGTPKIVTVSLCGSDYDTTLRVYSDCTLTNQIAMNDDAYCDGVFTLQSEVSFLSDGTSTYVIMVEGSEGQSQNTGEYHIAVSCVDGPQTPENCEDFKVLSNDLQGAYLFNGDNDQRMATDIEVGDAGFTIYGMEPTLAGDATKVDFVIYADNNGIPGAQIGTRTGTIVDKQLAGNEFGYDFYKYTVGFDSSLDLDAHTTYWIEVVTDAVAWEITSALGAKIGNDDVYTNNKIDNVWEATGGDQYVFDLVCSEILATHNINSAKLTYYPNPVNDVLNISADQKITSVSVYNVAGQKVINNVKANYGQVNVSRLTSGTYIVTAILENGKTETFKVIKK